MQPGGGGERGPVGSLGAPAKVLSQQGAPYTADETEIENGISKKVTGDDWCEVLRRHRVGITPEVERLLLGGGREASVEVEEARPLARGQEGGRQPGDGGYAVLTYVDLNEGRQPPSSRPSTAEGQEVQGNRRNRLRNNIKTIYQLISRSPTRQRKNISRGRFELSRGVSCRPELRLGLHGERLPWEPH